MITKKRKEGCRNVKLEKSRILIGINGAID